MNTTRSRRARVLEIVERAHEHPEDERDAYLRAVCGDDPGLLSEARELLAVDDSPDGLLPGNALAFIDHFKGELGRATRHAELRVRHSELLEHLLAKLRRHGASIDRFELQDRLGRGGMGEVFRVLDRLLRRDVALKRVRGGGDGAANPGTQIRFLQEAQVVAQLDHPHIPTVYEIGVDDSGRLFFTMPLVAGKSLGDVLEELPEDALAWQEPRILEGLLQAARAMAHAHERGVIHRDLKPANLMLGRLGVMHVVDWGIARVVDEERAREVLYGDGVDLQVASDLSEAAATDTAFETVVGSALGTPSFMSPEQAAPEHSEVGPATDIYSLGAILYQVLSGLPAYTDAPGEDGGEPSSQEILTRVQSGPPTRIARLAPTAPAELVAIAERAMQRDPAHRFPSVRAFVDDLEAYLVGRVVQSYERGVWPQVKKWVRRNRTLAASIGLALLFAVSGVTGVLVVEARREADARRQVSQILRLSALQDTELLERAALSLWPARAALLPQLEEWRDSATEVIGHLSEFEGQRVTLETRAVGVAEGTHLFVDSNDALLHRQLGKVIDAVRAFGDPATGPLFGTSEQFGPGVALRIETAKAERSRLADADFKKTWVDAIAAISASPAYGGIRLSLEGDLLPLGENAHGLWEFAVLSTGDSPTPAESGWMMEPATAVVLILVPGGTFYMGSQKDDPEAHNWSVHSPPNERGPHLVDVAPFYISKYELTAAQWERIAGFAVGATETHRGVLPVRSIHWQEARTALAHVDLQLPTEAQWECAARGGTEAGRWTGQEAESLYGLENVAYNRASSEVVQVVEELYGPIPTGRGTPIPVDAGGENPFGLVQVLGNVMEWCEDSFGSYDQPVAAGTGERIVEPDGRYRMCRGGSFLMAPFYGRSARREERSPDQRDRDCGVRPARLARLAE